MGFYYVSVDGGEAVSEYSCSPLAFSGVNSHVLICGSSGSGKSFFGKRLFQDPDGLMLFKPDPEFSKVPLISNIGMPDLFRFSSADVADSYLYSLGLDMTGIMASSLVPLLMDSLENSNSLDSFFKYLESLKSDHLVSSVASVLRSHFLILSSIYFRQKKKGRPPASPISSYGKTGLKVNFAGLGNFRSEFAAELLLREYYSSIGGDLGTLFIDEFHHVSRKNSIIDTLLREFRASGQLVGITQNLSDVSPSMLSNFGTILLGRTIHPLDISYLYSLNPELPGLVSSLPPFVFLNLSEYLSDPESTPLYRWYD